MDEVTFSIWFLQGVSLGDVEETPILVWSEDTFGHEALCDVNVHAVSAIKRHQKAKWHDFHPA